MSSVPEARIETILLVDLTHRINTKNYTITACTECSPLLGRRPSVSKEKRINCSIILLGVILICGIFVGGYLLAEDNRDFPVKLVFDMVDRTVWDSKFFPVEAPLISSNVRNIYIMQTNGVSCHTYEDCVSIVQHMQKTAIKTQNSSLPYNFVIGGDGETYEIRGWTEQSGFSFLPRNSSLTIGILGTFSKHPPSVSQLTETYALISESLRRHKIRESYQIYGIRNVSISPTNSDALFRIISEWDHWNSTVNLRQ